MLSPPSTHCKGCIFTNHTVECRLDKISFYKKNHIVVEKIDGRNVIKDLVCPYYRTEDWLLDQTDNHDTTIMSAIRRENILPYYPVFLFLGPELLRTSLRRMLTFKVLPKEIYIIFEKTTNPSIMLDVEEIMKGTNITWHVYFELEENAWHNIFKFYNRSEFMLLISGFPTVRRDWAEVLANKVQDKLLKFSYAENEKQTMTLIPAYVYNSYYFEYGKSFLTKLRQERHKQKCIL